MTEQSTESEDKTLTREPERSGDASDRRSRLKHEFTHRLTPGAQSVVVAWASFTATFAGVRALTHWIRDGHGPAGGGMSVGGQHFHHYNIGIGLLAGIGAVALRGKE